MFEQLDMIPYMKVIHLGCSLIWWVELAPVSRASAAIHSGEA
jgi:hypothetical protein